MTLRRLVRLLAAVGLVAGVCLMSGPANAHHEIDFDSFNCDTSTPDPDEEPDLTPAPTEPPDGGEQPPPGQQPTPAPQNCIPSEGERIWGTRVLEFRAETDGARPFKRIALYILSEEEGIPDAHAGQPLLEETYSRDEDVRLYDTPFSWDSVSQTPYNGKYKIRVEADTYPAFTGDESHPASVERKKLRVDNPPKAIDAPKILATTIASVTVQWEAAPEPDVLSYTVYRAVTKTKKKPAYSAFKPVGVVTGAAYRDADVDPGFHWYSVKVTRRSIITPKTGISSTLSPISGVAQVKSPEELQKDEEDGKTEPRKLAFRDLTPSEVTSRLAAVSDAPFAYKLPYDPDAPDGAPSLRGADEQTGGGINDPRGPVLPVAVGMFLVSSALAVGRMPY